MHAGQRTMPATTRNKMQSNLRWVPMSRSPEDGKFRGGLLGNAVVRPRTGAGRRRADHPQGTKVHVMGARRGLSIRLRSPQSGVGGAFWKVVHRSGSNRLQSPLMLTRKTKNPLGVQAVRELKDGRKLPRTTPSCHPLAHKTPKWSRP